MGIIPWCDNHQRKISFWWILSCIIFAAHEVYFSRGHSFVILSCIVQILDGSKLLGALWPLCQRSVWEQRQPHGRLQWPMCSKARVKKSWARKGERGGPIGVGKSIQCFCFWVFTYFVDGVCLSSRGRKADDNSYIAKDSSVSFDLGSSALLIFVWLDTGISLNARSGLCIRKSKIN